MSRAMTGCSRLTTGRVGYALLTACVYLSLSLFAPTVAARHSVATRPAAANRGGVVYSPDNPAQFAGYPRVIRLAHSGRANGALVASFGIYADGHDSVLIYRSADNGASWAPLSTVADTAYGGRTCCATIYETPRALGATPAGTLLLGTSEGAANTTGHELKVFRSGDHGRTWRYLSSCARGAGGLWEAFFGLDRAGHLVCYFSDERQPEYSQFLGHVVSTDGGRTWGPEHVDVAVADGTSRPGMAILARLPTGRYIMSFEVCSPTNCEAHVKTSDDGDDWGKASDLGPRVQTTAGRYPNHTPYLAWAPAGGPHGELLLVAKEVLKSDGSPAPESGRVLFVNKRDGTGPWSLVAAPIRMPVEGKPDCANYSSALLPSAMGSSLTMVAAASLDAGGCEIRYGSMPLTTPDASGVSAAVPLSSMGAVHNPITPAADPFVTRWRGSYYLTGTHTGGSLEVWHAPTLGKIRNSSPTTVWTPGPGQPDQQVWSPSLFLLPYRNVPHWFIYFTASPDNTNQGHRIYVLESTGVDPLGSYTFKGQLSGAARSTAIDPSILRIKGKLYIMYVEEVGANVTYIAPLRDPLTQIGAERQLIYPDQPWEMGGASGQSVYPVAEGPEALYHEGQTFVIYSGSDTGDYTYGLGRLTYDGRGDPLDSRSWRKAGPVFTYSRANGVFGPGRASFTTAPDGKQSWMVYHAKDTNAFTYNGRTTRAQPFSWNRDGTPNFGTPVKVTP